MSNNRPWTPQEIQFLQQHYPSASREFLVSGLPGRTLFAIRVKAQGLGLNRSSTVRPTTGYQWSQAELSFIRKYYPHESKEFMLHNLPNRSWDSICNTASRLGVSRKKSTKWTDYEVIILKKSFATATWEDLFYLLPDRSRSSIQRKAEKLGLTRTRSDVWSERDNALLREHYPTSSWETLHFLFPSRSKSSISYQAQRLGIYRKRGF